MKTGPSGSLKAVAILTLTATWMLPAQRPNFEVAAIQMLNPPFRALKTLKTSGTLVTFEGYTVPWFVSEAFGLKDYQVSIDSVPPSARQTMYRIEARAPGQSAPTKAATRVMLQSLLAERFHLAVHREVRTMPVYALVVDKNGPALKAGSGDGACASLIGPVNPSDRNYRYRYTDCTLDPLIDSLSADRPILDKTGLSGRYDIEFFATPEFRLREASEPGDIRFLDAVRKLGLRLDAQRAPIEMVVIDHVDSSPAPN